MNRPNYKRIAAYCKNAGISRDLDPITLIGKLRQGNHKQFVSTGDCPYSKIAISRFLDRVTLHLLVGQSSDATETLYKEIDKR